MRNHDKIISPKIKSGLFLCGNNRTRFTAIGIGIINTAITFKYNVLPPFSKNFQNYTAKYLHIRKFCVIII